MRRIAIVVASCLAAAGLTLGAASAVNIDVDGAVRNAEMHEPAGNRASVSGDLARHLIRLEEQQQLIDAVWFERSLREALPNVRFDNEQDDLDPAPAYEGIVTGRVSSVSAPRFFRDESFSGDEVRTIEVESDSGEWGWALVELTIEVSSDFDPTAEDAGIVVVGLVAYTLDLAYGLAETLEGQRVIVGYQRLDGIRPDPDLMIVARAGALFGLVAEDGAISLPILGEAEREFLGDLTTLDALEAAAAEPETVIPVAFRNGSEGL